MGSLRIDLTAAIRDLLASGEQVSPDAYARTLMQFGPADHVVIATLDNVTAECTVIGTSGPIAGVGESPIAVGTTISATASTRLTRALEKRVWRSSDFSQESNYSLMVDQLARTAGFRSGCGIPIVVEDNAVVVICPSSVTTDVDWTEMIAAVRHVETLLKIGLSVIDDGGIRRRVLIVHRDPLVGHGLARLVDSAIEAEILFADGAGDARLSVFARAADVVIVDDALAEVIIEEHLQGSRSLAPAVPVVIVAESPTDRRDGEVVPRSSALTDLVPAVARALTGRGPNASTTVGPVELTRRERQLLSELDTGATFQAIASRMRLRTTTVRSYSRGLFAKLDVHSRGEAVYEGRRRGLI